MNRQQGELFRKLVTRVHEQAREWAGLPPRLVEHPPIRRRVRRTLEALGNTVFPSGGAIPYSGEDVEVAAYVLDFLGKIPRQEGELFTAIILLYEYVLPKVMGKGWRFSEMPESKRSELLEALHEVEFFPLRFLNISVRMFLSFAYMADDRVLREMGYFKRYAYASDPRDIDIRWWPIREEAVEALETDEPETNGESEAAPLQSQSAETTQAETRNSELGT